MARVFLRLTILGLAAYVTYAAMMWWSQEKLIFPGAFRDSATPAEPPPAGVMAIRLSMADGAPGEAWFALPAAAAPAAEAVNGGANAASAPVRYPAVVYFHGNDDLIESRWRDATPYLELGVALLMPEYRGYGRLGGEPSEAAIAADGARWVEWLAARDDIDPARIGLHGLSLGGAVAVQVAGRVSAQAAGDSKRFKPRWVALEATLQSMDRIAHERWLPAFLLRHHFRSDRVLPTLGVPTLLCHGLHDALIPIDHARRLHALTPGSELVEIDCDHARFVSDRASVERFVRAALR